MGCKIRKGLRPEKKELENVILRKVPRVEVDCVRTFTLNDINVHTAQAPDNANTWLI